MALSHANRPVLATATRLGVEQRFQGFPANWAGGYFIPAANRYQSETVKRIETDLPPKGGGLQQGDLADYVAASTLPHCLDGWSYLGRALSSLLAGDVSAARHLGYYAELRAAMALLASEGIGIFDQRHVVLPDPSGGYVCQVLPTGSGTHEFTWDAFDHWAQGPRATRLLCEVVRIGTQTLDDWVAALNAPSGSVSLLLQTHFVRQWGLDLGRFSTDHRTRNFLSYRPTAFHTEPGWPTGEVVRFVRTIWTLSQPVGQSRFYELDRFLLRRVIRRYIETAFNVTTTTNRGRVRFTGRVVDLLNTVGPPGPWTHEQWRDFLVGTTSVAEPEPLFEASQAPTAGDPAPPQQVISRAYLLLRLATGACRELVDLIAALGSDPCEALEFWWHAVGVERGLWSTPTPPDTAADLWEDVNLAIADLDRVLNPHPPTDRHQLRAACPDSLLTLGGTERIGLWGVGL